jgi:nitrate reductase gamma subunit
MKTKILINAAIFFAAGAIISEILSIWASYFHKIAVVEGLIAVACLFFGLLFFLLRKKESKD